jgi:hypothetical protein
VSKRLINLCALFDMACGYGQAGMDAVVETYGTAGADDFVSFMAKHSDLALIRENNADTLFQLEMIAPDVASFALHELTADEWEIFADHARSMWDFIGGTGDPVYVAVVLG